MRSFASILFLFAACLVVAAILAYPVWLLVGLMDDQPIHRVLHRVAMLSALISLIWLSRRWHVADKQSAGFGLPRAQFLRQIAIGLAIGAVIIVPPLIALQILEIRTIDEHARMTLGRAIARGLTAGLLVGVIEETFFRGSFYTAIERESGRILAIVLPSLLYASVHFLGGRLHVPAEQIEWMSGFAVLGRMFIAYNDFPAILDSFTALFSVGVLLALVRAHTGNIAACIGMHAGWVCVLYYYVAVTDPNPASEAQWLVGSYDGVIGWGTVMWMAVLALIYLASRHWKGTPATAAR